MEFREELIKLHQSFGLDVCLSSKKAVKSYAKDLMFPKKVMTFLEVISYPENQHLRKKILDSQYDINVLVSNLSDDLGYDPDFLFDVIEDIRFVVDLSYKIDDGESNVNCTVSNDTINDKKCGVIDSYSKSETSIVVDLHYDNGLYTGEVKNKTPHGKGVHMSSDCDRYEGDFINGKRSGKGTLYYFNGDRYEGYWKNNRFHGSGKFFWGPNCKWAGDRFEGEYVDGLRDGFGIYYYSNGNRFEGNYIKGKRDGKGTFFYSYGSSRECYYVNGKEVDSNRGNNILKNNQ